MSKTAQAPATMAKKQKTIQLPEDAFRLADAYESGSGARFNRQVLAALFQFYFSPPVDSDNHWMRLAVAVEKGTLSVSDVPEEVSKHAIRIARARLGLDMPDRKEGDAERALRLNRADLAAAEADKNNWHRLAMYAKVQEHEPLHPLEQYLQGAHPPAPQDPSETPESE